MTNTETIVLLFVFLAFAFLYHRHGDQRVLIPYYRKCSIFMTLFFKFNSAIIILCVLVIIALYWLYAVRDSQLAPHRITETLDGKIVGDFWATNPIHFTYETKLVLTTNGLQFKDVPVTNYYWHIWPIFQK
jgi:hypothetical protein